MTTYPEFVDVRTGLYSEAAKEIMDSVFGQLSDGWGENNPRNDAYWRFGRVERLTDGELVIRVKTIGSKFDYGRWTYNKLIQIHRAEGDQGIKNWMARLIKKTMQMELKDENVTNGWRRDNADFEISYLNYHEHIVVRDVYLVYEHLLGRNYANKYDSADVHQIVGEPYTDEEIVKNEANAEQKAKLENSIKIIREATELQIKELQEKANKEIADIQAEIRKIA